MFFHRKAMLAVAALTSLSMVLVGCGGSEQASKAEDNTLVVYNCNTDDWTAPIVKEFQEQTGIQVQLVAGGSGELMARVRAEKENPLGDIMWGGSADAYLALEP